MILSEKTIDTLKTFGFIILISLFAYFVLETFKESQRDTIQTYLNNEKRSNEKIDSLSRQSIGLEKQLQSVQNDVGVMTVDLHKMNTNYENYYNQLKKLKNEKDYIPLNVPVSEQSKFLSGYKYKEYK